MNFQAAKNAYPASTRQAPRMMSARFSLHAAVNIVTAWFFCVPSLQAQEMHIQEMRAQDIVSPVNVSAQRALFLKKTPASACPALAPLPKVLTSQSFYTDAQHSKVDPKLEKKFYAEVQPVRDAEEAIAHALSAYIKADAPAAETYAQCALAHIHRFATDGAMLSTTHFRGTGQVRLFGVTPVLAYAVLKSSRSVPVDQQKDIEAWISHLANFIIQAEKNYPYKNNIDYWGYAALASAGVALQDRALLEHALGKAAAALDDVDADGLLPHEIARGDLALSYSLFATQALSISFAIAESNGYGAMRQRNNGAMVRLMHTMLGAVIDRAAFAAAIQSPGSLARSITQQQMSWLALARRYINEPALVATYCQYSPLYNFRAGGEWATFLGDPTWCSK